MAAKKVDFRRLKEERELAKKKTKIDSPLAKYNSSGQLFCVLCNAPVKSELLWNAHVQGKKHKENFVNLKNKKKETVNTNSKTQKSQNILKHEVLLNEKRKSEDVDKSPQKKLKVAEKDPLPRGLPSNFFDKPSENKPKSLETPSDEDSSDSDNFQTTTQSSTIKNKNSNSGLPSDFFDKNEGGPVKARKPSEDIPEGFFDDPKLDAKARHVEYKDPAEQEWEKFQKEIQMENQVSEALVEEDDEVARIDRQLHELNEQSQYFLRAHELRDKQTIIKQKIEEQSARDRKGENEPGNDSDDFEDFFDWRAKKAL